MYYQPTMSIAFETEKNRKAMAYTAVICATLILLTILVSWQLPVTPPPVMQDLIEINLGNEIEGSGTVQPLIKGDKAPSSDAPREVQHAAAVVNTAKEIPTDENTDKESALVTKPVTKPVKAVVVAPVVKPEPKPQIPKIAGYKGTKGTGNGATEDNGFRYQGNNPNGRGDAGNPNGKADSYGTSPGGKSGGGPRVIGDRSIVHYYSFPGQLEKATIFALVKVSAEGVGRFVGFAKNSTSTSQTYATSIIEYLHNIKFNAADHESTVTVQFNFTVN